MRIITEDYESIDLDSSVIKVAGKSILAKTCTGETYLIAEFESQSEAIDTFLRIHDDIPSIQL